MHLSNELKIAMITIVLPSLLTTCLLSAEVYSELDMEALIQIDKDIDTRNALNWFIPECNTNPGSGGFWTGVEWSGVESNMRVRQIEIPAYAFNGRSEAFQRLSGLEGLAIVSAGFDHAAPDFGYLENLKVLIIRNSNVENINGLKGLKNLEILELPENNISDISLLSGLNKLRILDLENNPIEGIEALRGLSELEKITLTAKANDLDSLSGLKKLKKLILKKCMIASLEHGLNNVSELSITHSPATLFNTIKNAEKLEAISLRYNGLTNAHFMRNIPTVKDVDLQFNQLTNLNDFKGLTNLTRIDISNNVLENVNGLENNSRLQILALSNNKLRDCGDIASLQSLVHLELDHNDIDDISSLHGLNKLQYLQLSYNRIVHVDVLQSLNEMHRLLLQNNYIRDIGVLAAMDRLRDLRIDDNKINDISALCRLPNLKILSINNNELPLSQLHKLKGIPHKYLGIQYNVTYPLQRQNILIHEIYDLSGENEFDGIVTNYHVTRLNGECIEDIHYSNSNGIFTFLKPGEYIITMQNQAIQSSGMDVFHDNEFGGWIDKCNTHKKSIYRNNLAAIVQSATIFVSDR